MFPVQRLRDNELLSRGDKSRARKHISKPKAKELISLTPLYKKTRSALALRIGCIFIQLKTGKLSDGTWLTDYYVPNSPSSVKQRRIHSLRLIASFWCVIEKYFIDYATNDSDNLKFIKKYSNQLKGICDRITVQKHLDCVLEDIDRIFNSKDMSPKNIAFLEYLKANGLTAVPADILAKSGEYQRPHKRNDTYSKAWNELMNSNAEFQSLWHLTCSMAASCEEYIEKSYSIKNIFDNVTEKELDFFVALLQAFPMDCVKPKNEYSVHQLMTNADFELVPIELRERLIDTILDRHLRVKVFIEIRIALPVMSDSSFAQISLTTILQILVTTLLESHCCSSRHFKLFHLENPP